MLETWKRIWKWLRGWSHLGPHFVVGDPSRPYLRRWYVIPRFDCCSIYLHQFLRDDDDRAMHDHPWPSLSILLCGRYVEQTPAGRKEYRPGSVIYRPAEYAHRIELVNGKPAWTLFFCGPRVRDWGFHCPQGWIPWQKFVANDKPGKVGPGCDQPDEGVRIQDQPPPVANQNLPVWEEVIRLLPEWLKGIQPPELLAQIVTDCRERDRVGRERYGMPLQTHNGRDALVDAYQELQDSVVYLMQAALEEQDPRERANLENYAFCQMMTLSAVRRKINARGEVKTP